jgi:hypothetical protein
MKSTSARSTISAPQSDASPRTWWLTSSTFEASISPLIDIRVSPVPVFALIRARRESKDVLVL